MNNLKAKKITVGILIAAVLFVTAFSAFYIAEHADHNCTHAHCPICVCIHQCESILHGLGSIGAVLTLATPLVLAAVSIVSFDRFIAGDTPVSRKVRLND